MKNVSFWFVLFCFLSFLLFSFYFILFNLILTWWMTCFILFCFTLIYFVFNNLLKVGGIYYNTNNRAAEEIWVIARVAEWSKAVASGAILFGGAGSNPAPCILKRMMKLKFLCLKNKKYSHGFILIYFHNFLFLLFFSLFILFSLFYFLLCYIVSSCFVIGRFISSRIHPFPSEHGSKDA